MLNERLCRSDVFCEISYIFFDYYHQNCRYNLQRQLIFAKNYIGINSIKYHYIKSTRKRKRKNHITIGKRGTL